MILDADAFHVLTANVQDTVYIRLEECSCIVVGDGLNLTFIQHQGRL